MLDQSNEQTEILVLDSPFVANAKFEAMVAAFGDDVTAIDCTFDRDEQHGLRDALGRIRGEAEEAVRSGAGHLVLSDRKQSGDRVPVPMIRATSAVHWWLTQAGLRTVCSINGRLDAWR